MWAWWFGSKLKDVIHVNYDIDDLNFRKMDLDRSFTILKTKIVNLPIITNISKEYGYLIDQEYFLRRAILSIVFVFSFFSDVL